jgi:hypothetical protein
MTQKRRSLVELDVVNVQQLVLLLAQAIVRVLVRVNVILVVPGAVKVVALMVVQVDAVTQLVVVPPKV